MTDRDALLKAILATPDNDLPRLVYADWLEERAGTVTCGRCSGTGNTHNSDTISDPAAFPCPACSGSGRVPDGNAERAEFIRVQCEITATIAGKPYTPAYNCSVAREQELWPLVKNQFLEESGAPSASIYSPDDPVDSAIVRRGFVEVRHCSASVWILNAKRILARCPIRKVILTRWPDYDVLRNDTHGLIRVDLGDDYILENMVDLGADFTLVIATAQAMIISGFQGKWPRIEFVFTDTLNHNAILVGETRTSFGYVEI